MPKAQATSRRASSAPAPAATRAPARAPQPAGKPARKGAVKGSRTSTGAAGTGLSEIHAPRLQRLRQALKKASVGHLLVTNPKDVTYLTGFLGEDSFVLLSSEGTGRPIILSDSRFDEELAPQRSICDVVIRTTPMAAALTNLVRDLGVSSLGFQSEVLTVAEHEQYSRALDGVRLVPLRGVIAALRIRKDAHEVRRIENAIRCQEAALKATLPHIKPGITELAVAALLEAQMKQRGASAPAFETIVGARANGSLPHYRPHAVKLAKGQPLLIDWGAVVGGYRGDMTRTFSLGTWTPQMREIYTVVLDAHEAAAAALAPGKLSREIDGIARGIITKAGYGDRFGHGLGHGLGLATHEEPRVSHLAGETRLEEGMVVTIEPGIYLPGVGGVRIEDDYLITAKGARNLCTLPRSLKWSTI